MTKLKQFITSFFLFLLFDFIWLGFVVKDFNLRQLYEIGRIENGLFQMQYSPAFLVYLLLAAAMVIYVLPRIEKLHSLLHVFLLGAPMGLIIYGVFDFTNLSILKNYPIPFIAPDIAWGTFVFGFVTVIVSWFCRNVF